MSVLVYLDGDGTQKVYFVEYSTDEPIPFSAFVRASEAQAREISEWLDKTPSPWFDPYIGPVVPISFEQFKTDYMEDEEDDEPTI